MPLYLDMPSNVLHGNMVIFIGIHSKIMYGKGNVVTIAVRIGIVQHVSCRQQYLYRVAPSRAGTKSRDTMSLIIFLKHVLRLANIMPSRM